MSLRPLRRPYGFLSSLTEQPIQANPMPLSGRSGNWLKTINICAGHSHGIPKFPDPSAKFVLLREISAHLLCLHKNCSSKSDMTATIFLVQVMWCHPSSEYSENGTTCTPLAGRRMQCGRRVHPQIRELAHPAREPAHCCRVRAAGQKQNDRGGYPTSRNVSSWIRLIFGKAKRPMSARCANSKRRPNIASAVISTNMLHRLSLARGRCRQRSF